MDTVPFTQSKGWDKYMSTNDNSVYFVDNSTNPTICCRGELYKKPLIGSILRIQGEAIKNPELETIRNFYAEITKIGYSLIFVSSLSLYNIEYEIGIRQAGFIRPLHQTTCPLTILVNTIDRPLPHRSWKNNVKKAWWQKFVMENPYNVGVDCAILMNPQTWVASGHLGGFSDPLMDCKECHERFRADKLIEDFCEEKGIEIEGGSVDAWSQEEMKNFIEEHQIPCPSCGKHNFTDIRQFNLMFKTFQGVTEDAKNTVYLRPETAQGIFVNFKNVQRTSRKKIPFGIGQIGKSFRNEITPGNFTFRTREFEQMELEFFCKPDTDLEWFDYWKSFCLNWLSSLGLKDEEVRYRDHDQEELSFYSKATTDVEFLFPFGWGELWGIADRTDYDLTQHQNVSGQDMTYFDDETKEKYIPYVIEPSLGADRVVLAFLCSAYDEENIGTEEKPDMRTVLHFHPALAPVKIGVLPLSKKLNEGAEKVFAELSKYYNCEFDDRGNIGKRYRRQDEIGTPFCVTYDFDSEEDGAVTVRDRDTMEQERVKIEDLKAYFEKKFEW